MARDGRFWEIAKKGQLRWDRLKLEAKRRVGGFSPLVLVTYRGHGGHGTIRLIGRLVEDKDVKGPDVDAGLLDTVVSAVRRFESDEIPEARIVARHGDTAAEGTTDHEGFFRLTLEVDQELEPGWVEVEVELLESMAGEDGVKATAQALVPADDAEFGVISDIDDTVMSTHATELTTQLLLTLSRSAGARSPMPGATPLYRTLERGRAGHGPNPFFYISNSGWGLYDLIEQFLEEHGLPLGPIYLQDIAILEPKSPRVGNDEHKPSAIRQLLDDFPDLDFVLIGDSGQDDPETYRDIVKEHPDRIRAVLIRAVTPRERDAEVRRIIQEIADMDVAAAAAESSVSLARAAADFDLISQDAIADVREAMVEEEA